MERETERERESARGSEEGRGEGKGARELKRFWIFSWAMSHICANDEY
jgi:hypothetical protein